MLGVIFRHLQSADTQRLEAKLSRDGFSVKQGCGMVVVRFEIYDAEWEIGLAVDILTAASKSESSLRSSRPFVLPVVSDSHALAHALASSTTAIPLAASARRRSEQYRRRPSPSGQNRKSGP
jgi:hypothetical protein